MKTKKKNTIFPQFPQAAILQCRDSKKGAFWQFCNNVTVLQCYIQYLVKILQNCYKSVTNSVKTRYITNRNYFTSSYPICFLGENSHLSGRKVAVKSEFHACKVRVSLALKSPNIKHWQSGVYHKYPINPKIMKYVYTPMCNTFRIVTSFNFCQGLGWGTLKGIQPMAGLR